MKIMMEVNMTNKSKAYKEGEAAYAKWWRDMRRGYLQPQVCPYERGTDDFESWHEGYNDAAEKES